MKVYDTDTAIELIYQNRHTELDMFVWDCVDHYNNHASEMGVPNLPEQVDHNTDFWLPDYYKELDVEQYIRQLCPDDHISQARVDAELEMFTARNLTDILRLMLYGVLAEAVAWPVIACICWVYTEWTASNINWI
jgi:hypothetical protein